MRNRHAWMRGVLATVMVWGAIAAPRVLPAAPAADWAG